MNEENREYTVAYHDTSLRDGTHDVTITLSEDAEDALFNAFEREIGPDVRSGAFPKQTLHLFRRLVQQRNEHPPWIDTRGDVRTYDLALSEWDYHVLSKIIGASLSNVLGPDGADRYVELVDVWQDITEQMQSTTIQDDQMTFEEMDQYSSEPSDPDNGTFECFVGCGQFALYSNDQGNEWYVCTVCEQPFAEVADTDNCPACSDN